MKLGDMAHEGWSYERLSAEGWVNVGAPNFADQYRAAGFRLRSWNAAVYAPGWLGGFDIYRICRWYRQGVYPAGQSARPAALQRVAARVQEHGDEDLAAAFALGGGKAVDDLLKAEGIL